MAKTTIAFHPAHHKWFLAPDFTNIALSDESPIADAIDVVLRAKKKALQRSEKEKLIQSVIVSVKSDKVGALRALEKEDWSKIDIPLLCRAYLRHLILQAAQLTHQQLLECDFNSGLPFDWKGVQDKVTQILAMGFTRNEAIEAILVTGNKQVDLAAQYLLSVPETRKAERARVKRTANKSVPPSRHYTIIEAQQTEKEEQMKWLKKSENELDLEMLQLKRQIMAERTKREKMELQAKAIARATQVTLFEEYLKGIIADPIVNTTETQRIEIYKTQRNISADDFKLVLQKLQMTEEEFDQMKSFEDTNTNQDECLVCYDPPRDHMLIPCHHVCMCGDCAEEYMEMEDAACPLCDTKISKVSQVFYF